MQKSRTFRYGYDVGDFLSSAFSGWLFAVVLTLFLYAKGGGIRTLVNEIGSLRNTGAVATILAVTVFVLIAFTELIALCRHGRRIVSSVLLLEYLLFASATIPNVAERNRKFAVLAAFFILLVPVGCFLIQVASESATIRPQPVLLLTVCGMLPILLLRQPTHLSTISAIAASTKRTMTITPLSSNTSERRK